MTSPARAATAALGAVLAALLMLPCLAAAAAPDRPPPTVCGPAGTGLTAAAVTLTAEQVGNARVITTVAAQRRLSSDAAVIAVAAAMQESSLINVGHGDAAGPDSRGLFQQGAPWGPLAVRMDPAAAAGLFFFADLGPGVEGLTHIPGWQRMSVAEAAQAVQHSANGAAYAQWQAMAAALVGQLWPLAATDSGPPITVICPGGGGDGKTGGGSTTVPAGFTIAGSPAGVVAVRFALAQLGKPYRWGAAGPDAYDCSGLTMAAWAAAGVTMAHFTGAQVTAGSPAPTNLSQPAAGDLVFIPGSDGTAAAPRHVGMLAGYVATASGVGWYLIQAPHTGAVVQLIPVSAWAGEIVAVRHIA